MNREPNQSSGSDQIQDTIVLGQQLTTKSGFFGSITLCLLPSSVYTNRKGLLLGTTMQSLSEFLIPSSIRQPLGHRHLTCPPEHHSQLVTLQNKVKATRCSKVERRRGGGYQHVSLSNWNKSRTFWVHVCKLSYWWNKELIWELLSKAL